MQWDPRHVGAVVEALAPHVEDPRRRALVTEVAAAAAEAIERLAPRLPRQVVHCDVTDWNVIGRRDRAGRLMPCGVIDFGDVTRTLRVCELAVAASIAYGHDPDEPLRAAAEIVRGFDAACPLEEAELEALPHLIAARAAIVAVGTEQQAVLEPHNAYAQRVRAGDWAICETAAAQPAVLAEAVFRLACGRAPQGSRRACRPASGRCPAIDRAPPWISRRPVSITRPAPGALGAYGEARCTRRGSSRTPSRRRSISASTSSRRPAATCWRPRRAVESAGSASCGSPPATRGAPGGPRARGGRGREGGRRRHLGHLARAPASCRRTCTCRSPPPGWRAPGLARRRLPRPGSRSAPTRVPLLGLPDRPGAAPRAARAPTRRDPAGAAALLRRAARDGARAAPAPLRRAGRAYLDCVNNVAVVGHSHPARDRGRDAAAAPAEHELALPLREHDRYAERLAALLPEPLERVFLVSTGSEANDLALRLARAATGAATCSASATLITAGRRRPTRSRRARSTIRWAPTRRPRESIR